jgi:hypothetical protein
LGSSRKNGFLLSKWYLDCVTDEGSAFIGYAASLSWRGLSLNYSSLLLHRSSEGATTKTALQGFSAPEVTGTLVRWSSPRLGVAGTWEADARAFRRRLFESAEGGIEWECLQPRARAEVSVGGLRLEGLGYAERLKVTLPPWRLPFEELRWGRFLSDVDALVWVNWRGAHALDLVLHNGVCVRGAPLADHELSAGRARLALGESALLREGSLGETALSGVPGARRFFPLRILRTRECKWLSRGVLTKPDAEESAGWAIHEVVRWPADKAGQYRPR